VERLAFYSDWCEITIEGVFISQLQDILNYIPIFRSPCILNSSFNLILNWSIAVEYGFPAKAEYTAKNLESIQDSHCHEKSVE
jgi:hypothetical protein